MRVLVTHGSPHGGTAGLAEMVADSLRRRGAEVDVRPAHTVERIGDVDLVVLGGALYAGRWPRDLRRLVRRQRAALSALPVVAFSSGPLDDSAADHEIAPTASVRRTMDRIGATEHVTFGGRLEADVKGFPAAAMAKDHAGDWRDPAQVDRWVDHVMELSSAQRPR